MRRRKRGDESMDAYLSDLRRLMRLSGHNEATDGKDPMPPPPPPTVFGRLTTTIRRPAAAKYRCHCWRNDRGNRCGASKDTLCALDVDKRVADISSCGKHLSGIFRMPGNRSPAKGLPQTPTAESREDSSTSAVLQVKRVRAYQYQMKLPASDQR